MNRPRNVVFTPDEQVSSSYDILVSGPGILDITHVDATSRSLKKYVNKDGEGHQENQSLGKKLDTPSWDMAYENLATLHQTYRYCVISPRQNVIWSSASSQNQHAPLSTTLTKTLQISGKSKASFELTPTREEKILTPLQNQKWDQNYQKLLEFITNHNGDFPTSRSCSDDLLIRWINRQRVQFKRLQKGQKSTLTKTRIRLLNGIGFIWDGQEAIWNQRFEELLEYKLACGHCIVNHIYPSNQKLSHWVKSQRRQYQLYRKKMPSHMTRERIRQLNQLGFVWKI